MKKHKVIVALIFIVFTTISFSQDIEWKKYPFNLETLQRLSYKKDSIIPAFINDAFYFVDIKTMKKIFPTGFQEAYPFFGQCALVKKDGKYGVIDRKGIFIVKPMYLSFKLPSYQNNIIIFPDSEKDRGEFTFDLYNSKKNEGYIGCEKPLWVNYYGFKFKGKNNKYGIRNSTSIISEPIFDSIYYIHFECSVAKLNSKIGVIDKHNNTLIPFEYDDITISDMHKYPYPKTIGLKKDNLWEYFILPSKDNHYVVRSEYKCINLSGLIVKNTIGVFKRNEKYNILFKDGTILPKDYDWISDNGTIAIDNNTIYFIDEDGLENLYYESK